jgi:anti-sigma factor (TIGR02949 family)
MMMKRVGGISCEDALARLWEFLDDELPPQEEAAVRKHLEICNRCYPKYDFQRAYFAYARQMRGRQLASTDARRDLFARLLAREERTDEEG